MADIFISYANEDRERAAQVASLLESEGWSVWWDRRIPAGRTWRKVLEDALLETRCMMVLWSKNSVSSQWVAEEAEEARRLEKTLVPVLIDPVEPPIGFRAIQAADLRLWDGSIGHPAARLLIADVKSLLGATVARGAGPPPAIVPRETAVQRGLRWLERHWLKAALGCAALVAALIFARRIEPEIDPQPPSEPAAAAPDTRRLTGLAVSGTRNRIKPAETVKLTLKRRYSDGSEDEVQAGAEWLSSDTAVAVVDEHGEVTGLKAGTANIVAKIGAVESSEWRLGVEPPAAAPPKPAPEPKLVALKISSAKQELLARETVALRASAIYSDKSEKALSSGIEWRVSDRSLATLNERGELIARRPGKVEVVARAEKISSPPQTFVIREIHKEPAPPPAPPKPIAPPTAKPPALSEQTAARVLAHLGRARIHREQGNYPAALAELERAKTLDGRDESIQKEIEQTKRACKAEKVLGNPVQCD